MRLNMAAAMLAILIGSPATAVAQPPIDPQDRCAKLPAALWPAQAITFKAARPIGTDGCAYDGLVVPLAGKMSFAVEHLTLGELDFPRLYAGEIPLALRLRADGAKHLMRSKQPVIDYMVNFNVAAFTLSAVWHWRAADKVLRIDDLTLSGAGVGLVRLSGELARADPARMALVGPRDETNVAVVKARFHLENRGFFEHYVVPATADALLRGASDPEARVEILKQQAIAAMRTWFGKTGTTPATVDALAAFVRSLPRPRGTLDVSIDLPHPFGLDELAGVGRGLAPWTEYFPTGAVRATYAP